MHNKQKNTQPDDLPDSPTVKLIDIRDIADAFTQNTSYSAETVNGCVSMMASLIKPDSIYNKTLTMQNKIQRELAHAERVSRFTEAIAQNMTLDAPTTRQIKIAGYVHDIGKMQVDEAILTKKEPLSIEEWNIIRKHPEYGYQILLKTGLFKNTATAVIQHHERWDGRGYPNQLKGQGISLTSRIITIADSYDAMTNDRAYRKALTQDVAMYEIYKNAGFQFDPEIAEIFCRCVLKKGWGVT